MGTNAVGVRRSGNRRERPGHWLGHGKWSEGTSLTSNATRLTIGMVLISHGVL